MIRWGFISLVINVKLDTNALVVCLRSGSRNMDTVKQNNPLLRSIVLALAFSMVAVGIAQNTGA